MNQLSKATSPYLRQHMDNPVNWYPWGEEAFAKARRENKLIFLSIGYSTCHWCHVMAHESFEDPALAEIFNAYYVAIKVDREEHPAVDDVYMDCLMAMTGAGGWPMSLFLTPDAKPIHCASYLPPDHLESFLYQVHQVWQDEPAKVLAFADSFVNELARAQQVPPPVKGALDQKPKVKLMEALTQEFDGNRGGFGRAPKFPMPHRLRFLWHRALLGDAGAKSMAAKTSQALYAGGIHDQVGGGYSRYSVDEAWLVPHFEKMLYDNAGLLECFALGFQATADDFYKVACRDIVDYLEEVLASPQGLYYAAEDADSEGKEGTFYLWDQKEIQELLGPAHDFIEAFGITLEGNFEGRNILSRQGRQAGWYKSHRAELSSLKAARQKRARPHRDEKLLLHWNGLALSALAKAARIFGDDDYLALARRLAQAMEAFFQNGYFVGSLTQGQPGPKAVLEAVAAYGLGLCQLYQTDFQARDLAKAKQVWQYLEGNFADGAGGYRLATKEEDLIFNPTPWQEGALASGNSLTAEFLFCLANLTFDKNYGRKLEELFHRFSFVLLEAPIQLPAMVDVHSLWNRPRQNLILAGPKREDLLKTYGRYLGKLMPQMSLVLLCGDTSCPKEGYFEGIPLDQDRLFHCSGVTCDEPLEGSSAILGYFSQLDNLEDSLKKD